MCNYQKTILENASTRPGQTTIHCWLPQAAADQAIVISHGMGEHVGRYKALAHFFAGQGIAVYAANHRGHGEEAVLPGHFSDNDGWQKVVDDLAAVVRFARQQNHRQVVLVGHSMGSFVARHLAIDYGHLLSALILSGSGCKPPWLCRMGRLVADSQRLLRGKRHPSKLIDWMSFIQFNGTVKDAKTPYDWMTRDDEQIRQFIDDPLTGFLCTTQFWHDLMDGLIYVNTAANVEKMPKDLPVYIVSGDQDPVGDMGKGLVALQSLLQKCGLSKVDLKLYEGARHEVFNEINAEAVYQDCYHWIQTTLN